MSTIYLDLARERFAQELESATEQGLRSLAYSYLGLSDLPSRPNSTWQWKLDMVREECIRRGRLDLFEAERAAVELETAAATGSAA